MILGNSIVGYKYYILRDMVLHSRTLIQLRDSCGRTVLVASTLKSVGETSLGHKLLTSFCSLKLKLVIQGLGKVKLLCGRSSRRELSKASLAGLGRDWMGVVSSCFMGLFWRRLTLRHFRNEKETGPS